MAATDASTEPLMTSDHLPRISRGIKWFVDHPFTKLGVGLILIVTSSAETYYSIHNDFHHYRLRVHHGLLVLGFVNVLAAMPGLIQGLEQYLAFREKTPIRLRLKRKPDQADR